MSRWKRASSERVLSGEPVPAARVALTSSPSPSARAEPVESALRAGELVELLAVLSAAGVSTSSSSPVCRRRAR